MSENTCWDRALKTYKLMKGGIPSMTRQNILFNTLDKLDETYDTENDPYAAKARNTFQSKLKDIDSRNRWWLGGLMSNSYMPYEPMYGTEQDDKRIDLLSRKINDAAIKDKIARDIGTSYAGASQTNKQSEIDEYKNQIHAWERMMEETQGVGPFNMDAESEFFDYPFREMNNTNLPSIPWNSGNSDVTGHREEIYRKLPGLIIDKDGIQHDPMGLIRKYTYILKGNIEMYPEYYIERANEIGLDNLDDYLAHMVNETVEKDYGIKNAYDIFMEYLNNEKRLSDRKMTHDELVKEIDRRVNTGLLPPKIKGTRLTQQRRAELGE